MSIPPLAVRGLPGKHCRQFTGCCVFPPALSPYGRKQAEIKDRPWTCSSCLCIDSCPTARRSSVCINILFPKCAPHKHHPFIQTGDGAGSPDITAAATRRGANSVGSRGSQDLLCIC